MKKAVILTLGILFLLAGCAQANATPSWALKEDFSSHRDGVLTMRVLPNSGSQDYQFPDSACPIEISSFQVDMLIVNTGYSGPIYAAHLDLHGLGSVRSWYAQIGYHYNLANGINVYCQAYSYSSDSPRYFEFVSRPVGYNEWHTFKIEVVPTDNHWGYSFEYFLDGEQVCDYQPSFNWDGDRRYKVLLQRVEIIKWEEKNLTSGNIEIQLDNYYGFESPARKFFSFAK